MTDTKPESLVPEPCEGWKIDGVMYPILDDAQRAALVSILQREITTHTDGGEYEKAVNVLVNHRAEVLAILSLEAPKQRKARADKGRPRTKKIAPVAPATPQPNPPSVESTVTGSGKYKNR